MVSGGGGVDGYGNNQVQETWLQTSEYPPQSLSSYVTHVLVLETLWTLFLFFLTLSQMFLTSVFNFHDDPNRGSLGILFS